MAPGPAGYWSASVVAHRRAGLTEPSIAAAAGPGRSSREHPSAANGALRQSLWAIDASDLTMIAPQLADRILQPQEIAVNLTVEERTDRCAAGSPTRVPLSC